MSENIISLKAYRTLKECRNLLSQYRCRLEKSNTSDLLVEIDRYRKEVQHYPQHLLTLVKGEILTQVCNKSTFSSEVKMFVDNEGQKLKIELRKKLEIASALHGRVGTN